MEVISDFFTQQQGAMSICFTERSEKAKAFPFYPLQWFPTEQGRDGQPVPTTSAGEKENTKVVHFRTPTKQLPERVQPEAGAGRRRLVLNADIPDRYAMFTCFTMSTIGYLSLQS
jgi:hypothetical protein